MNDTEQKLVVEAVEKLFKATGADHTKVAGLSFEEVLAIAKEVCAVAGVVCPIISNL